MTQVRSKKDIILGSICFATILIGTIYSLFFSGPSDQIKEETLGLDPFAKLRAAETIEVVKKDPVQLALDAPPEIKAPPKAKIVEAEPEPTSPRTECDELDRIMENCPGGESTEVTSKPEFKKVVYVEQKNRLEHSPPIIKVSKTPNQLAGWSGLVSGEVNSLEGKSSLYPGPVIRAGCRVLGVIQDELRVNSGEPHMLTINVRGPLNGCTLPPVSGIRLVASAKLNSLQNRINASVHTCSDTSSNRKSVECKAQVKSITGADGLEGEIYDQSGWGVLIEFLMATASAPVIGQLAQTASTATTLWGAHAASRVAESMQRSVERISQKITRAFEGREIKLARNATVIVTFSNDTVL